MPGAVIIERNHLEWRLAPSSDARLPQARPGQRWIVLCAAGYSSSLAAYPLNTLSIPATGVIGVIGGCDAWQRAGLPSIVTVTLVHAVVSAA